MLYGLYCRVRNIFKAKYKPNRVYCYNHFLKDANKQAYMLFYTLKVDYSVNPEGVKLIILYSRVTMNTHYRGIYTFHSFNLEESKDSIRALVPELSDEVFNEEYNNEVKGKTGWTSSGNDILNMGKGKCEGSRITHPRRLSKLTNLEYKR
jgi:hypothetical protein